MKPALYWLQSDTSHHSWHHLTRVKQQLFSLSVQTNVF